IRTPLMPKVEIADYKKIAKELNANREEVALDESEVERALLEIRKELDRREKPEIAEENNESDGADKKDDKEEVEPSELTDEKVQKISPMKTVAEFEKSVREDLKKHKENQANEKHRLKILEKILEESTISLPEMIVESE